MKSLMNGCAAAVLLLGLATQAQAQIQVREAPVHAIPVEEDGDASPGPAIPLAATAPRPMKTVADAAAEPAPVRALARQAPAQPALSPDEHAFFAVLGQRVTDAASAYENYVRRAAAIDPAFSGAASVQRAVKAGAAYHPRQLHEGIVAYAALVALRNEAFVEGVRAIDNPTFADGLAGSPEQVMQVRGAAEAAADVTGVLRAQGAALTAAGKAITRAAYDIQAQPWSRTPVADPKGVLEAAKTSAGQPRTATVPSKEKLLASLVTAPHTALSEGREPAASDAPDVVRGLALAALAILGKTGDGKEAQYEALLHDASSVDCLDTAKMNLNQCLAVAGPQYEDVYCAGRHAVSDTGKCVSAAAGEGPSPALDAAPAAPEPRLQQAEAVGPEEASAYGRAAPVEEAGEAEDEDLPAAAPAPAPAVRRYAETPAEAMPDPRARAAAQPAPAYAPPQRGSPPANYARNDYAPPAPYAQQGYAQDPYPAYPQQPYAQQQQPYAPAYQGRAYAPAYAAPAYPQPYGAQPYYPQGYAQPGYGAQAYYGR